MKSVMKLFLPVLILIVSCPFCVMAAEGSTGHLDFFNDSGISGWFYENSRPEKAGELTIRLTDLITGKTVQEYPVTTSLSRPDLENRTGPDSTPGFYIPIDWNALGDGLYIASILKDGQEAGNSLSFCRGSLGSQSGLPEGITSVKSLGTFRITDYCACKTCTAGWGGYTSSGTIASPGRTVAVDPRSIPMGSRLLINGSVYTAEDTGSAVKGNHIDIFCNTHAQARNLPFQSAQVYLLN